MKNPNIIKALQYFEAVARHQSMKLAARDLGVTESAVSHQMRECALMIGQQLLVKSGRGIALTAAGDQLAKRISSAFVDVQALVKEFTGNKQHALQLAVCSAFGPSWLSPRLNRFMEQNPDIDLRLRLYARDPMVNNEAADALVTTYAIRTGYSSVKLLDERVVAVCSPAFKAAATNGKSCRLISSSEEEVTDGEDWLEYCSSEGIDVDKLRDGSFLYCTHFLLSLEMARNGVGVALIPDFMAEADIAAGRLVKFFKHSVATGRSYRLTYRHQRAQEPKIKALRRWLELELSQPETSRSSAGRKRQPEPLA